MRRPLSGNRINGSVISVRYERLKQKAVHTAERFLRSRISFPAGETTKNFSYDLLRSDSYICLQKEILL